MTGEEMLRLELDCAPEADAADAADAEIEAYAARYGVSAVLVERVGPAGGNPLWAFTGTEAQLRRLCSAHVAGHDVAEGRADAPAWLPDEVDFLMEAAEPVA